jgi:NADPH:quinone reductase-like Zn-dependent oxidoreductase/NAD(P)-dependent dehydrogenase (short-subunit alcohol dehydrogenase family)/acyl carrier protein
MTATYQHEASIVSGQHVLIARRPYRIPQPPEFSFDVEDEAGTVLLAGEASPLADALDVRLRAAGLWVERLPEDSRLSDVIRSLPTPIRAVIDLHAAAMAGQNLAAADLPELHARTTRPQMALAADLARLSVKPLPPLILVTSGGMVVRGDRSADPTQAPVWGLGRTISAEYQHLRVRLVDLPAESAGADIDALAREALAECDEVDVVLRGERRFVLRIDRVPPEKGRTRPALPSDAFRLEIERRGILETMSFRRYERLPLEPDAVEIDVKAAGLNFRDVMNAMGLLPAGLERPALGLECSGVVTRVGHAVADLHPGDEVMAFCPGSFSRYAVAPRLAVVAKPANLTHEQAATVPVAIGTAWYCLEDVARLRSGERVLIHSATGGVGHAAIQIAQRRGAEIFATAGSDAKRQYLRELGIRHVFDSRSDSWVEGVRAATGGKGVDVILNSLSGSAIRRGLDLLAPLGRFVEIGVTDIFENRRLGLGAFRNSASYFTVRLDVLLVERPEVLQKAILEPVSALLERGELQPLPATVVPARRIGEAFSRMLKSLHRGKIVVSFEGQEGVDVAVAPEAIALDRDKTYLVTGGTRGFGFRLAEWLIERGARHIALFSRSGALEAAAAGKVEDWRARGITVRVAAVDVSDERALAAELEELRRNNPLGGIIHGAMVLADATIEKLDDAKFAVVLGPKAGGALNLDRLTREDDLAFFVLLSSVASVVGNPGQANYNAANAVLEAVAHRRRLDGRPATVLNLGGIADVGFVSRSESLLKHVDRLGVVPTPSDVLIALLERALRERATQWGIGRLDPARILSAVPSNAARFSWLASSDGRAAGKESGLLAELGQLSGSERTARLTVALREAVARITGADAAKVPADRRLTDLGLDSLMATQLASWVQVTLAASIPTMQFLKGPTIAELAAELALAVVAPAAEPEDPAAPRGNLVSTIAPV